MSLSDAVDDVLATLQRVSISASEFILVLLTSEKHSAHLAVKDILSNGCEIVDALTKQTSSTASKWATDITKDICAQEIYNLAAKGSGTHFDVTHTTVKQLEDFRVAELATIMEKSALVTWNLLESMLSGRTQSKVTIGRDRDGDIIMESSSDEEAYWEEIGEGDLEGSLVSSLANNAEFERTKLQKHRAAKTLLKKITVLSIMMRSTNQHSNTLQSLLGMFLQSTHTPQKVIETLERMGISVSVNAIHAWTQSLAAQTQQHLRSLGRSLLAAYAYDNFAVDLKTHEHKIENSMETLKHLTSGLMFPLQHNISKEDLRCSEVLWKMSPFNTHAELPPKKGWADLLVLHVDTPDNSGLSRRDRFNAWKFLSDLISYGPPYFSQFRDKLCEPETIEAIPITKMPIIATSAMDISNSTVTGNIQSIVNLLQQGGIGDPAVVDDPDMPDISEHVVLFHSDLGTGERLQSAQQHRGIENTPWNRLQHVIFIPGLFHLKMAAVDTIWWIFLQPSILQPKETGHYGSKPGFRRMHELIMYDRICRRLDCWRVEVAKHDPKWTSLEEFAASKLTLNDIEAMAHTLARNYIAGHQLRRMRRIPAAQRDVQYENGLLLNRYMLIYEELSYAMNTGDIGRV
ncbi:hypothetical protein F4604DRAFT_1877154 [Suillus subluteus]|nr:hypothetical protein F4604DRAFT_1877154 [Suillus subluteus]